MRFKIDENLPNECASLLRDAGHDAETVYTEMLQGKPDSLVVSVCQQEDRILVTLDRGFGNLITYPPRDYPGFVVLQPHRQDKATVLALLRQVIPLLASRQIAHQLWVVEEGRVRIRDGREG